MSASTRSPAKLALCLSCGWSFAALGCGNSEPCNPRTWTGQCATAEEFGGLAYVGVSATALSDAGGFACPSVAELQYKMVSPYHLHLEGDHFVAGPEPGRSDGLCCYQTSYHTE